MRDSLKLALPPEIVIPADAMEHCLRRARIDMLGDDHYERLCGGDAGKWERLAWACDPQETEVPVRNAIRLAAWRRSAHVQRRWDPVHQAVFSRCISDLLLIVEDSERSHAIPVSWWPVLVRKEEMRKTNRRVGHGTIQGLVCTTNHHRWCEEGGDPDLGRYLAEWVERNQIGRR